MRYIANPVLSTLSRRSLYQYPPGCIARHFIISLSSLAASSLFRPNYPVSPFLLSSPSSPLRFNLIFSPFPPLSSNGLSFPYSCSSCTPRSRYDPGTLANSRPLSIPDPHYTIDLYRAPYLRLHTTAWHARIFVLISNNKRGYVPTEVGK